MKRGRKPVREILAEVVLIVFLVSCMALFVVDRVGSDCRMGYRAYERDHLAVVIALERSHTECGAYPAELKELSAGARGNGCHVPLPPKLSIAQDYWGSSYVYSVSADRQRFQLRSAGADRKALNADDIVSDDPAMRWREHYDSINWLRLISTVGTVLGAAFVLLELSRLLWRIGRRLFRPMPRQPTRTSP